VIIYWNYESPVCGQHGGGIQNQFSYADTLLASSSLSDFKLLELTDKPDTNFGVTYAGWDRSGDVPSSAVAIHHPSYDEKSISFEDDALSITTYLADVGPGNETHLRVEDWDLGTTEGGSSGSPLFDANHRIVGQLHGGYAACGNDRPDWYGRIYTSWEGGGTAATRLRDHLDPTGSGVMVLNRICLRHEAFTGIQAFNIKGHLVHDLGTISGSSGENTFEWNGRDGNGRPVPAGLYVFKLDADGKSARGNVIRLR